MKYKEIILVILVLFVLTTAQPAEAGFSLILNFDDGYQGVYQYAFPLLNEHNLPAVVFVPVNYVGLERHLTLAELQEMKQAGWEIGSHTMNHPDLSELTEEGLKYEIGGSRDRLIEDGLLEPYYASFATPMTVWNERVERIAREYYQVVRAKQYFDYRTEEAIIIDLRVVVKETSIELIKSWIDRADGNDNPLVLIFHEVGPGGNIYFYPEEKFARLVELIKDLPVTTFRELSESYKYEQ